MSRLNLTPNPVGADIDYSSVLYDRFTNIEIGRAHV